MTQRSHLAIRDRAFRLVRRATFTAVGSAIALAGAFSTAAAVTFSGKPIDTHHDVTPVLPNEAAPVQKPPPPPIIVTQVIHVPAASVYTGGSGSGGGAAAAAAAAVPRPPGAAPIAVPPMPPAPVGCVSTPSKPC